MEKIKSFTINHDTLEVGLYLSREDYGIMTYDIRLVKPNQNHFLSTGSLHTIEHLFATYARNTAWKDNIVYVGPMGCRTGCYLLTRDMSHKEVIKLVQDSFLFIRDYEGKIPGTEKSECGNYLDHDLDSAKKDVIPLCVALKDYQVENLAYAE